MNFKTKTTSSTVSNTRIIQIVDDKIVDDKIRYILRKGGVTDYFTYNKTLFEILKQDRIKPFCNIKTGRMGAKVRINGKDVNFNFYDLAYACYNNLIKIETFIEDMQKFKQWKKEHDLVIDHADDNLRNSTVLNLSLMQRSLNDKKRDIVKRVKKPVHLVSAYCGNCYKIEICFEVEKEMINKLMERFTNIRADSSIDYIGLHFICRSADEYVKCLRHLTEVHYEWAKTLKDNGRWIKNSNEYLCKDTGISIYMQEKLSNMEMGSFQEFSTLNL